MTNILHIYGQEMWHGEAYILGTRPALEALRDAINNALEHGYGFCPAYVGDGEGYNTLVAEADPGDFEALAVPYTDEIAQEKDEAMCWPNRCPRIRFARADALKWLDEKHPPAEAAEIRKITEEENDVRRPPAPEGDVAG